MPKQFRGIQLRSEAISLAHLLPPSDVVKNRVAPDQLFSALDGTQLQVGGADWRVEVCGVIDEPERRWVQLALDGTRRLILTLRLDHTQGARHVVGQIASWLTNPQSHNVLQRFV